MEEVEGQVAVRMALSRRLTKDTPSMREIAHAALYLARDAASLNITGAALVVDGRGLAGSG
jgi:NAD(P)-dependent dehydrogenase (short-subunit alcohol dehydrogenase family)